MKRILKNEEGSILGIAMIYFLIFSIMGLAVLTLAAHWQITNLEEVHDVKNRYAVESTLNLALWRINSGSNSLANFELNSTTSQYSDSTNFLTVTTNRWNKPHQIKVRMGEDHHFNHGVAAKQNLGGSHTLTVSSAHKFRKFDFLPTIDITYFENNAVGIHDSSSFSLANDTLSPGIHLFEGDWIILTDMYLEGTLVFRGTNIFFFGENTVQAPVYQAELLDTLNADPPVNSSDLKSILLDESPLSWTVLTEAINSSPPMNTSDLKDVLLNNSPLSSEVLIEVINRSPSMSSSDLKDVLLNNSPLTTTVLQNVIGMTPPMSSSEYKDVFLASSPLSASTLSQILSGSPSMDPGDLEAVEDGQGGEGGERPDGVGEPTDIGYYLPAIVFENASENIFIGDLFGGPGDTITGAIFSNGTVTLQKGSLTGPVIASSVSLSRDFTINDTGNEQFYQWPAGFGTYDSYDWPKQIIAGSWRN